MNKLTFLLGVTVVSFCFCGTALAQYKAPSQYFRKDSPAPNKPGGQPGAPSNPATPAQPKFKDVAVNSQFFFTTDTNRAYPWIKISPTTAKNAKGVTQSINSEIQVRQ